MLRATPYQDVHSIGKFLNDSGYETNELASKLDLLDGLFATGENLQPLLMKTEGDSLLAVLARLFFIGWPVEEGRCAQVIPESVLKAALGCGLLERKDGTIESLAAIVPFRDNLIAFDCGRVRNWHLDMVPGPGIATQFIARMAAGGENETTLDLGTGSGVLAVEAAAYSAQVTGTDINERTLGFATFSAALNGVTNAEFLCGDTFAPVAGRRFSRIIANPPFFLSPAKKFTYSDSPLELDGFSRRVAKEGPAYLQDGGYFQMICQWVEIEGEPWERRIQEWTGGSGCDVLILLAPKATAIGYAELRDKEARQAHVTAEFDFASRVGYLRERGVKIVHSGVITMHKRSGTNWFRVLGTAAAGAHVGPGIRERFDTITYSATRNDSEIFDSRLRFAADVQLATVREPGGGDHWTAVSIDLVKSESLVDRLRLDEAVADCLPFFNGQRSVREVSEMVAAKLAISVEESQKRCLLLTRRLLQSSYLLPAK